MFQAVDEGMSLINPHADLQAAVVVAKRRGLDLDGVVVIHQGDGCTTDIFT